MSNDERHGTQGHDSPADGSAGAGAESTDEGDAAMADADDAVVQGASVDDPDAASETDS